MIYVARHGETDWNREGRYQGQRESQLTETGIAQADALADALSRKGVTRVIASPLARCVETARPLAQRLGIAVETDRDLIEIAHGTWEGRLRSAIERDEPAQMPQNARKLFPSIEIERMSNDPVWLDKAIRIVEKQIQEMNKKQRGREQSEMLLAQ